MLILAATPIGNLGDVTTRLRLALENSTEIAAEDTRTTMKLLAALGISNRPRLIPLHDHNERQVLAGIIERAREKDVLVLSDAGMPTISDPGFPLVRAAAQAGVKVTVLPGPSAVLSALAVSGLPTDRFTFEGFLPRKAGERDHRITELVRERRTMVFFESPVRLGATLIALSNGFGGNREAVVCRELTKLHEEVKRGSLQDLSEWATGGVRGEICIVVAGWDGASESSVDLLAAQVRDLAADGLRLKDAAAMVASEHGLRARDLYEAALAAARHLP